MSSQVKQAKRTARERKRERQRAARLERKRERRMTARGVILPNRQEREQLGRA